MGNKVARAPYCHVQTSLVEKLLWRNTDYHVAVAWERGLEGGFQRTDVLGRRVLKVLT